VASHVVHCSLISAARRTARQGIRNRGREGTATIKECKAGRQIV
jgi:hypothetical protein